MTHHNHNGLFAASFFIRIIAYIFGFLFFYLIIVGALIMNPQNQPPFTSGSALIDGSLLILTVASPFIFRTRTEARDKIFEYIEMFYNSKRRHSYLGFISPNEFEKKYNENLTKD